ncbi:DUF1489 family protein [Azorhizobium doebereinerae]|uniref:DUF1489 family protein n=1 Tax=Azorhizobium doebereinerae TaxID=281091 RepID=UPI00042514C8|nr:DUF1489 family protein [Azorhizobium doebereinerae]
MPLHLLKLCVGATSVADLEDWIKQRLAARKAAGEPVEQWHTTRMVPTRVPELTDGGSLYWVIKGEVACRQALLDVRPFTDADGIRRCHLVLDPKVIKVAPRPSRPFQGWRYLKANEAPVDLGAGTVGGDALPEHMERELRTLGLL